MAERSLFEQLGGTYTEIDGILYPNLTLGDSDRKKPVFTGRYGGIWMAYLKENYPDRYRYLLRFGKLQEQAVAVNDEAHEMIEEMMQSYLNKHKPEHPDSTIEMWQLREQVKKQAEEIALHDVVCCFH